jgi:hypothetical protein
MTVARHFAVAIRPILARCSSTRLLVGSSDQTLAFDVVATPTTAGVCSAGTARVHTSTELGCLALTLAVPNTRLTAVRLVDEKSSFLVEVQ